MKLLSMKWLRIALGSFALASSAQEMPVPPKKITYLVTKPYLKRALEEAELDRLIHEDLRDAQSNIVDWRKRARIRELCLKLEVDQ